MKSFQMFSVVVLALCACKSEPEAQSTSTQPKTTASPAPTQTAQTAPAPQKAEIVNEFTAAAQVVAVAPETRSITLRREDGTLFDVRAGDEVRNFDQIAAGDELRVHYKETLTATKLAAGEAARPAQGAIAAARAEKGERPGAAAAAMITARVKVESIDKTHDIAVYSLASGELIARRIKTPQGREFLKGLAVGDTVQLDYSRALALGVEKM